MRLSGTNISRLVYPPFGIIKISDSHSFQLLVEMDGLENAILLFKTRSKIVRMFSAFSIHIMILIQISIIIQFSLESEINSFSNIKEERFRVLLTILQIQLNTLLKKLELFETRNEIHRYVYLVMKKMDFTKKSWKFEPKNMLNRPNEQSRRWLVTIVR